jgi:hypothetical protein
MFEPQRRADNTQWLRKDQKQSCSATMTISTKCWMRFSKFQWTRHSKAFPTWSHSHWLVLHEFCIKMNESFMIHLMYYNSSSRKREIVKSFLMSENVIVVNHSSYSDYFSSCDIYRFLRQKKLLSDKDIRPVLLAEHLISVRDIFKKKIIFQLFETG